MSTQLKEYSAIDTGFPTDENLIAFTRGLAIRKVLASFTTTGHISIHNGQDATGPVKATIRGLANTCVFLNFGEDDLPLPAGCFIELHSGTGIIHIYSK